MADRKIRYGIRFSEVENEQIRKKAEKMGVPVSVFVRYSLLGNKEKCTDALSKEGERVHSKQERRLEIRLTDAEKNILRAKSNTLGISVSRFVRDAALNYKIPSKTDTEMLMQVRKIGVNINQIAYKINREPTNKNITSGLEELKKYMKYLQNILSKID